MLVATLWYLAGCFVAVGADFRHFGSAVLWAPISLPMWFIYGDIFFGVAGMLVILLTFFVALALIGYGLHSKRKRLVRYTGYGLAATIGLVGGFAVLMWRVV